MGYIPNDDWAAFQKAKRWLANNRKRTPEPQATDALPRAWQPANAPAPAWPPTAEPARPAFRTLPQSWTPPEVETPRPEPPTPSTTNWWEAPAPPSAPSFVPTPTGMDGPAGPEPPVPDAVQRAFRWRDELNAAKAARPSINDAVAAMQARGEIVGDSPFTPPARPAALETAGASLYVPGMTYSRAVSAPIAETFVQQNTVPQETPNLVSPVPPPLKGLRRPLLPAEQQNIGDVWQQAAGDNAIDKWGSLGERFQKRYETDPWGSLIVEGMVDPANAFGMGLVKGAGAVAKGLGSTVARGVAGPSRAGPAAAAQIAGRAVKQFGDGAWAVAKDGSRAGPLAETATEAVKQFEGLSNALPKAKAAELAHLRRVQAKATSPFAEAAVKQFESFTSALPSAKAAELVQFRQALDELAKAGKTRPVNEEVAKYAAEQIKRLGGKPLAAELADAAREAAKPASEIINEIITMPQLKRLLPAASIEDVGQVAPKPQGAQAVIEAAPSTTPSKRYYHGTGSAFDAPDAAKFDPNGLYGPGYYMTDAPEVAGSYAGNRAPLAENLIQQERTRVTSGIASHEATLASPYTLPDQKAFAQRMIQSHRERLAELDDMQNIRTGPNVRAIDVPENLRLLPADAYIDMGEVKRILGGTIGTVQQNVLREIAPSVKGNAVQADTFYKALANEGGAAEEANNLLRQAGYDGIKYNGGQRIPMRGADGSPIKHNAVVIFPESLPKITNAISGTPMGSAPEIGGGIVGGLTYGDDPSLTPEENLQRRALWMAGGGLAGYGAKRLGSTSSLGGTVEPVNSSNAANRALGNMYANPGATSNRVGARRGFWGKAESARIAVVRAFTDEGVDLAKFQQHAAKAKGAPLTMDEMASELRRLNADKAAEVHLQEGLQPAIKAVGKDRSWLSVYLTHQDNIDVAKAMGNPNRSFSGGLTVADSRQALVDMAAELGPARMKVIEDAAEQAVVFGQSLLKRKVDAGLITPELYDDLVKTYPNYVPTRISDYLKDPVGIPRGKSLSVRDTGLRRNTIEGTTREREDPLASMVRNAYQTEALARKNETFEAFVKLRDMDPQAQTLIRPVADSYTATRYEAKVTGFIRGQRVTYAMPKALEVIIKGEPKAVLPGFAGAIWGTMMGTFRMAATSRNPVFLASNALLDSATYAIRETSRAGGPQHLPKVLTELVKAYGDAFGGVLQNSYYGSTAQFLKSGGGQFGFFQGTQGAARQTVEGLARNSVFSINNASDIKRLTMDIATFKPVEGLGERIELAPRVASYNLAKGRGVNNVKATINGRTVTIDFAQGGNFSKVVNQFVPFFNVGVQASVQPYRAFRENPKAFLATAAALLAGPTVAAEAWNRSDPQRARDYEDVPQYLKDQGIVIMLPGEAPLDARGNRKPQFVHLRMREFAPFTTLTREAAARAMGDDPREWGDLIAGTLGSVSPIQGSNPADALASFTPLGASTGLQLATNQDYFRDRMIATKSGDERAAALSKAVANALGVRPSQVDFTIRDLGAGLGGTALAASDLAASKPNNGSPQDMPVLGGLYGRFVRGNTGDRLDKARQQLMTPANKAALKAAGVELSLSPVGYTISDVPLLNDEVEQYQTTTNQYINEAIERAMATPNWDQYTTEQRNKVVRNHVQAARDRAVMKIKQQIGTEEMKRRRAAANAGG